MNSAEKLKIYRDNLEQKKCTRKLNEMQSKTNTNNRCIKDRNNNILFDIEKNGRDMGRIHKGTI